MNWLLSEAVLTTIGEFFVFLGSKKGLLITDLVSNFIKRQQK
jgi:hypothetical protein